ncbi:hypothetical protein EZV62_026471 [Acer yangbiense]|uniref:Gnk2-homologous domain-containing protein n=1 Tax=Acer yangbiense TaxID=1000413 RepID=A0A5C7GRU4_9ROSI|nr:hypothetical protein EZV62_026471 [Acer yangbiense]
MLLCRAVHISDDLLSTMQYCLRGFRNLISFFSCLLIVSISLAVMNGGTEFYCHDTGNFTSDGPFDNNRNLILSSLASYITINNGGFIETSIGEDLDNIYALALCRGDNPTNEICVSCVKATSKDIMTKCPHQKEAFMWGGGEFPCLVHHADHSISGKLDLPPVRIEYGGNLTEHVKLNLTEFDQIWGSLMDDLVKKVSWGSISFKFVTKEAKLNAFQMIYSLMQCTLDLSQSDCDICLRQSVADFQACCLRSARGKKDRTSRTIITIIVVASAAVMISIISIGILIFRVKKSRQEIERHTT